MPSVASAARGVEGLASRVRAICGRILAFEWLNSSGTTYEAVFRQRTADHGGHLLVTEYGGDLDTVGGRPLLAELLGMDSEAELLRSRQEVRSQYLTRVRAVVSKGALDRDVMLVPTRVSKYDFVFDSYHIPGDRGSTAWPGISLFVAVEGIIFVALRGRRQRV